MTSLPGCRDIGPLAHWRSGSATPGSAVPAFGQVQDEVAGAGASGAGRDVDEVAADSGAAGLA
jgi:hypothetical protein